MKTIEIEFTNGKRLMLQDVKRQFAGRDDRIAFIETPDKNYTINVDNVNYLVMHDNGLDEAES